MAIEVLVGAALLQQLFGPMPTSVELGMRPTAACLTLLYVTSRQHSPAAQHLEGFLPGDMPAPRGASALRCQAFRVHAPIAGRSSSSLVLLQHSCHTWCSSVHWPTGLHILLLLLTPHWCQEDSA
jgi:hypothetical protein